MTTNTPNGEEDITISKIKSNPTTSQGNFNCSTIELISKVVQYQLLAVLPNMIHEINKSTPVQGEQHMLAENSRLATGSTQGSRKCSSSWLAAGSTQGRNEQNEQSADEDEVEEIHVQGVEPPTKKANLSGKFIDINDDSTVSSGR